MASTLLVRPINFHPTAESAMAAAGSGGSWANGTYSFLLVAWWVGTDESTVDYAGWIKTEPAEWKNKAIAAGGLITIDWNVPVDQNGEARYPDHYKVYFQSGADYTYGAAGTECYVDAGETITRIEGTATSATLYGEAVTEKTFKAADDMTELTISPVLDFRPVVRQTTVRGFDGRLTAKSYAHNMPLEGLEIDIVSTSMTSAHYALIMLYIYRATHCRIEDPDTSYIQYYYGRFINATHLGTPGKTSRDIQTLTFMVENCGLF